MQKVTFKNNGQKEWLASTGERVNYYTTSEMGLGVANTHGWYITEENGDFTFNRFETLGDAKHSIIRRHNIIQAVEMTLEKSEKVLNKYRQQVSA
jgi:hypothetical protein